MNSSEIDIKGLKIPYSLWVCGFDSRPRHQFVSQRISHRSENAYFVPLLSRFFVGRITFTPLRE